MKSQMNWSLSRRNFLRSAPLAALAGAKVIAETNRTPASDTADIPEPRPILSRICIGQVKVYPVKGDMRTNHEKLMDVLAAMAKEHKLDVVITPEGFLDGYVSTEKDVTRKDMADYAIDPKKSRYAQAVSNWARQNKTWFIFGCTRKADDRIFNTALIYTAPD